jgi:hypothetical protein
MKKGRVARIKASFPAPVPLAQQAAPMDET